MDFTIEHLPNGLIRLIDTDCQLEGLYNADGSFRSGATSASVPHLDPFLRDLAYKHKYHVLWIYWDSMHKSGANLALGMSTSGKLNIVNAATIGPETFKSVYCLPEDFRKQSPKTFTSFLKVMGDARRKHNPMHWPCRTCDGIVFAV